jgi:multidrug efflux pump subunit AcrA (membrane-fusion protein)
MAAGLAVLVLAVFVPLPRIALASARFVPIAESVVTANRDATVDDVLVKEGDQVARGEELVVFSIDDAEIRLAEANDELEQARAPLREVLGRSPQGRPLYAELQEADGEVARAQSALLEAQKAMAGLRFDDTTLPLEQDFARAHARREEARKAIDALLPTDTPEAMKLTATQLEIEMLENQIQDPYLRAPNAGFVRDLNVQPGQSVTTLTRLLKIEDASQMQVTATVTPRIARLARAGDPNTLDVAGLSYKTTIESVDNFQIRAQVPNSEGALKPGTLSVNLEFKPRSLWQTF